MLFFLGKIIKAKKVNRLTIIVIYICLVALVFFSITSIRYTGRIISREQLISIIYLFPFLLFLSLNINEIESMNFKKVYNVIIILILFTGIFYLVLPNLKGNDTRAIGGFSYQTTSYFFAKGYMLVLCRKLFDKHHIMNNILAAMFILMALIPGGKGAIVTIAVSTLIYLRFSKYKAKEITVILSILGVLSLIMPIVINRVPLIQEGMERAFSFISTDVNVIWRNSTGRDIIYKASQESISKKPLFGWGLGASYYTPIKGYPHNIFLEFWLEGGIFYFLFMSIIIGITLLYWYKKTIKEIKNIYIFLPLVFTFVSLQFSGSYLYGNYYLWLSLIYYINHIVKREELNYGYSLYQ